MDGITSFLILQYEFTSVCSAACLELCNISWPGHKQAELTDSLKLDEFAQAVQNLHLSSPRKVSAKDI